MTFNEWQFAFLPAASLGVALLELDATLVGQFMISRPIVAGPLVGLACGIPVAGMLVGGFVEMLSAGTKPVGGALPLNGTVAAGCTLLLSFGPRPTDLFIAPFAGIALGLCHRGLESRIRTWRAGLAREVEEALVSRGTVPWGSLLASSVGVHLAATAAFVYLTVSLVQWCCPRETLTPAAYFLTGLAVLCFGVVGLAILLRALARKA